MASAMLCMFWTFVSFAIALAGFLHAYSLRSSQIFNDILLYGKLHGYRQTKTIIQCFEVPKRWFYHFYLIGMIVNCYVLYHVTMAYAYLQRPPVVIERTIGILQTSNTPNIDAATAITLLTMMSLQTTRRLLECLCVSIYSDSTMNLFHYMYGILFYVTFWVTVLSEAPRFDMRNGVHATDFFKWYHILGAPMFLYASYQQFNINVTFAKLRQNKSGKRCDVNHHVAHGGWFDLVSCPHYFMELVTYASLLVTSSLCHRALWTVAMSVFANQLTAGHFTHRWYRKNFDKYPRRRKAVIPFIF